MSKDTTEEVIARDVYKVGMTVRLCDGRTLDVTDERVLTNQIRLTSFGGMHSKFGSYRDRAWSELDIIGEVVTAPKAVVATKPKRAAVTSTRTEERVYSDGIVTHNGKVDGMTMEEARKERRYIDRCIDRLKRDGAYYGWEV